MIRINLLPHKKLKPIEKGLLKLRAIMLGLTVVVFIGLCYGYYLMRASISDLTNKNQKAAVELAALKVKTKEAEVYEKARLDLETKLRIIQELEKKKVPLTPLLYEINKAMTKDVWLTSLEKTGISFTLEGLGSGSRQSVDTFISHLKESPVFKDVAASDVKETTSSKAPGVTLYSFKISGKLAGYAGESPAVQTKGKKAPAKGPKPGAPKTK